MGTTKKTGASVKTELNSKSVVGSEPKSGDPVQLMAGVVDYAPYSLRQGEEYMNEQQRAHFKDILLRWQQKLIESGESTVTHMKSEAISCPDLVDRASLEEGFSLELRTRDRERKLLRKIGQVLERLNNNEYGFCDDCGADIGVRRLEARPTACKCIDCKTFAEIKEKQIGR